MIPTMLEYKMKPKNKNKNYEHIQNKNQFNIIAIFTRVKQQVEVITQNDHFKTYKFLYSLHIDLIYCHDIW